MYANQNQYSPVGGSYKAGSPLKKQPNKGESPASSPVKMPRSTAGYDRENAYVPVSKEQILGKPIEIIQGKCF